jgi:hypothetical protein
MLAGCFIEAKTPRSELPNGTYLVVSVVVRLSIEMFFTSCTFEFARLRDVALEFRAVDRAFKNPALL